MQVRKTEAISVRKTCVYARKHASTSSRSNFSQRSTRRWRKKQKGKYVDSREENSKGSFEPVERVA